MCTLSEKIFINASRNALHKCTNKYIRCRRLWRTLLLGQFLSILLASMSVSCQVLNDNYHFQAPTAQSFLNYLFLCIIFTNWLAFKPKDRNFTAVLKKRGWKYFLLAIVDVEANYLIVKSFQYTTLTSVQLLDCFSMPVVLLLSWLFIKVRYGILHIMGVFLALMGIGCLIYSDVDESTKSIEAKNRFVGDMMVILGTSLYGISNVTQEYVVKTLSIVEFLGMLGFFGSIVNGIQLLAIEREEVSVILTVHKWEELALIITFSSCLLLLYITMPLILQISSATSVNISLLSADFYALITGVLVFHFKFNWLYLISFAIIVTSVLIFNLKVPTSRLDESISDDNLGNNINEINTPPLPITATPCNTYGITQLKDDNINGKELQFQTFISNIAKGDCNSDNF